MDFIIPLIRFPVFIVISVIVTAYCLPLFVMETLAMILWLLFVFAFVTRIQVKKSWVNTYPNSIRHFWCTVKNLWSWVRLGNESFYSVWIRIFSALVILAILFVLIPPIYFGHTDIYIRKLDHFIAHSHVIKLVFDASLLVQAVMFLLFLACLYSWVLILLNLQKLEQASWLIEKFEVKPWTQLNSLSDLSFNEVPFGMEFVLNSGFKEYLISKGKLDKKTTMENVQKVMRSALKQEIDRLESNLWALATIGSVSPYVGLFGTVWGIMNSFNSLSEMQNELSLAMVAPGISEALIATAMGLLAAIPAVIAYNRSATAIDRLVTRYNVVIDDFTNFLQRTG